MNNIAIYLISILVMLSASLVAKPASANNPVRTVDSIDLNRYLGKWYQQAFYPQSFQKENCGKVVTAEYSLDKKGRINVVNTCYSDEAGTVIRKQSKGKAVPVNSTNSKLKVWFFWPFKGDYWVVKLDKENYSYSVVSDPSREYLWILTRDKVFPQETYQEITDFLSANGWNMDKLVFTGKLK